jgi:hypothetical protein
MWHCPDVSDWSERESFKSQVSSFRELTLDCSSRLLGAGVSSTAVYVVCASEHVGTGFGPMSGSILPRPQTSECIPDVSGLIEHECFESQVLAFRDSTRSLN